MAYGTYFDTVAGRLYLEVEKGKVVRLTGGGALKENVVVGCGRCIGGKLGSKTDVFRADTDEPPSLPDEADVEALERAMAQILEYLDGKRRTFDVPVQMSGTPFQKKVWEALCGIPYGETRSYGEIAKLIGCPRGPRAVGMACGRNPVMILVPCHRVVGSTGKLVGFGGGLPMKKHLLALEAKSRAVSSE